jgi:2-C-methyl-D-erythritol 4-phosphate cytidylyltransferase
MPSHSKRDPIKSAKAVILASGSGLRFQDSQPKQFMKLAGLPIIVHTLKAFQVNRRIDGIVVVCHPDYIDHVWELVAAHGLNKVEKVVAGGETRQASSYVGMQCCGDGTEWVLVHDSVRPFLSQQVIDALVDAVQRHEAVDTVIPSADTLVEVDGDRFITHIPDRACFRRGQTPQAFKRSLALEAHRRALNDGIDNATDDCQLVMRLGHRVFTVAGDEQNIKITHPIDLHIADKLFQLRQEQAGPLDQESALALKGKVAVVIGGTEGIGLACCQELGKLAVRVIPLSRHTLPPADVTDPGSLAAAFEEISKREGRIDCVINCAGELLRRNVEMMTPVQWREIFAANVESCFHVAQAAIPHLRRSRGVLLLVGSSSYTRGRGGYAAYSSAKAALVNFAQALAEELSSDGIRVNVVSPGRVKTGMRFRNFGHEPEGSLLEPEIVAQEMIKALVMNTTGSIFEVR